MQKEVYDYMRNHLDLLIGQTKSYMPFVKTAFPTANMADACFNLIVGNAFFVFLGQYAMRVRTPSEQDLAEFGTLVSQYRTKVEEIFK